MRSHYKCQSRCRRGRGGKQTGIKEPESIGTRLVAQTVMHNPASSWFMKPFSGPRNAGAGRRWFIVTAPSLESLFLRLATSQTDSKIHSSPIALCEIWAFCVFLQPNPWSFDDQHILCGELLTERYLTPWKESCHCYFNINNDNYKQLTIRRSSGNKLWYCT